MGKNLRDSGLLPRLHVPQSCRWRKIMLGESHAVDGDQRQLEGVFSHVLDDVSQSLGPRWPWRAMNPAKALLNSASFRHRIQAPRKAASPRIEGGRNGRVATQKRLAIS